ncbi:MAG: transposase [Acidobacteriota bacterium]|jgi:putative transposase
MAKNRIERNELVGKLMEAIGSAEDPLRAMAEVMMDYLMEAEVTAKIGAEAFERTADRTTYRNGFRDRRWDTRLGTLQLQVPKFCEGGYVPSFVENRQRSEQAIISVIQEAVVKGVSTRKIEAVLEQLGIAGVSAGQVSQLCATLDERVSQFREGPLGEVRYLWVDALYEGWRSWTPSSVASGTRRCWPNCAIRMSKPARRPSGNRWKAIGVPRRFSC